MAEVKKPRGPRRAHKPDCKCQFCTQRRVKEAREKGYIPMVGDNLPKDETVQVAVKVEAKPDLLTPFDEVPIEIEHIFEANPEAPQPKDKPKDTVADKGDWLKQWWKLIVGISIAVIGVMLLVLGNMIKNPALIVVGAVITVGGGFLGMQSFSASGGVKVKGAVKIKNANCLIISDRKVEFVELPDDQLLGMPLKCLNDGKSYNVHFKGLDGNGSIEAFTLPDPDPNERYYDPAEALNCLRMPLTKRYFNYLPSSNQVISVIVIGAIILIETVGLIALGG